MKQKLRKFQKRAKNINKPSLSFQKENIQKNSERINKLRIEIISLKQEILNPDNKDKFDQLMSIIKQKEEELNRLLDFF